MSFKQKIVKSLSFSLSIAEYLFISVRQIHVNWVCASVFSRGSFWLENSIQVARFCVVCQIIYFIFVFQFIHFCKNKRILLSSLSVKCMFESGERIGCHLPKGHLNDNQMVLLCDMCGSWKLLANSFEWHNTSSNRFLLFSSH